MGVEQSLEKRLEKLYRKLVFPKKEYETFESDEPGRLASLLYRKLKENEQQISDLLKSGEVEIPALNARYGRCDLVTQEKIFTLERFVDNSEIYFMNCPIDSPHYPVSVVLKFNAQIGFQVFPVYLILCERKPRLTKDETGFEGALDMGLFVEILVFDQEGKLTHKGIAEMVTTGRYDNELSRDHINKLQFFRYEFMIRLLQEKNTNFRSYFLRTFITLEDYFPTNNRS